MRLCFDTLDEVKDFVKQLKGTRGGKGGGSDEGDGAQAGTTGQAPPPLAPPAGGAPGFPGAGGATFAPPGAGAGAAGGAFPAAGASVGPSPEVLALVNRVVARIDGAIASGQAADQVLQWFRGQCGPDAANATLDQIKTIFLPKLATPSLENIAKLMAA